MKLGSAHQRDRNRSIAPVEPLHIPGYRLRERLEGPGECWNADGPGGFRAALRILRPGPEVDAAALLAEPASRWVRHPNLQASFGLWQVGPLFALACEPADGSLWERFRERVSAGHPGIPRDELLAALAEAAQALDYLNALSTSHAAPPSAAPVAWGQPHGDVAPYSILQVGGGVKIAALNPLRGPALGDANTLSSPLYPDYAAPERLAGRASTRSDQYSLALTYGHLRTGRPIRLDDLTALPAAERATVARALQPDPALRWPSSRTFLDALRGTDAVPLPRLVPEPSLDAPLHLHPAATGRTLLGASATVALATAAGLVALAATVWLRPSALTTRDVAASAWRRVSHVPTPPSRIRLQNPADDSHAPVAFAPPPTPPSAERVADQITPQRAPIVRE